MKFTFDKYIIYTKPYEVELMEERVVVVQLDNRKKPSAYDFKNKIKEVMIFEKLAFFNKEDDYYYLIIDDVFDFIDYIEILKSFANNKLEKDITYKLKNVTAKIVQKNKKICLLVKHKDIEPIYYDKYDCSRISAKMLKILSRCEIWQE